MALAQAEQTVPLRAVSAKPPAQRRDIQGLRALAVGLVIVYHLRPEWLPGGFIGVDVFFVISGYLIIGTLTGELRRTGTIRLRQFYARRIRRLLPAASLVLLSTVLVTWLLLPISRWPAIMSDVLTSSLNVHNWALAAKAADYAHATAAVSPVQHFWSLSVEEQFYLVIPLVLLICARLAHRAGPQAARRAVTAVALVTAASFVFSVIYSELDHGRAYFVTPTRMWELGLGGLTAMTVHRIRLKGGLRLLLGWGGLVAVLVGSFLLTTEMAFPGYVALLPTLGTVGLLLAGVVAAGQRVARRETAVVLGLQPLRYLGDISYSLYLWHWPVIVVVLQIAGDTELTRRQAVGALVLSLALAVVSKHLVEDAFRGGRAVFPPFRLRMPRLRGAYLLGAAMIAMTTVSATVPWQYASAELDRLAAAAGLDEDHPGALALDRDNPKAVPEGVPLTPDPAVAGKDWPLKDQSVNCTAYDIENWPPTGDKCTYGAPTAPKTLVLVGDSHAAMFSTVFARFVREHPEWRVKMMLRNGCPFNAVAPSGLTVCSDQNELELAGILALKPKIVVTSAMSPASYDKDLGWRWESRAQTVDGYESMLRRVSDAGIRTGVIRDVPRPAKNTPRCLEDHPGRPKECDTAQAVAFGPDKDPLVEAAERVPRSTVVDLTPWLCVGDVCPAVIGNVVVYRDNHLTDSYVRTLYGPLTAGLRLR
ncbi:acyltransferase family protein [Amycolatopsis regifaucium]|uniref:Acyltransferase n=1 Tax=Amycolatopsis regifaucium TaxID=546365 RepID=A0A154MPQ8_9PSEU|nr:acyltransferase family protein [Amycolatopsis regifaucium]KZB86256.1 acyltransferase [Amycolatopsis regifaucium]OKA05149.1 acyltransferase [Amycolatopsis regifaucium]SFH83727.1 Peptidoglycan/LPS O-acetylase OafA/YrhL, contains acyltransferase and SGNH-hydrolase domains [Amycolatopsis regifaucium]